MKKLFLITALIISCISFGQKADFDFYDIKDISSVKLFKKFCFEEGFTKTKEFEDTVIYSINMTTDDKTATPWTYYDKETNTFKFILAKYIDGNSHKLFKSVLNQVKNECDFYDFIIDNGNEFVCYTCPNATYKGKIGFLRGEIYDFIQTFDF